MIYNDDFVWLHFPKCAGTKIEHMFSEFFSGQPGLVQDVVSSEKDPSISWHDSIAGRESRDPSFELGNRTVVCSFRRLPGWLESRYNFEFLRNPKLQHHPEQILEGRFLEANGKTQHADNYVMKFLPQELLETGQVRFLRVEHFESDFRSIFGEFLDVSVIPDEVFRKKANVTKRCLPDQIREQLHSESRKVYTKCPLWSGVELLAYGDLGQSSFQKDVNDLDVVQLRRQLLEARSALQQERQKSKHLESLLRQIAGVLEKK